MHFIFQDLRYALRGLARTPGFTAAAVLTLGLGIGAHTAVFSVVDGLMISALPFRDADRLVNVFRVNRTESRLSWGPSVERDKVETWAKHPDLFEDIAMHRSGAQMVLADTGGQPIRTSRIAPGLFKFLGAAPAFGREFDLRDTESNVAIISHQFWMTVFAGDRDVLSRTMTLDGREFAVVGVMPPEFNFPVNFSIQAWLPLSAKQEFVWVIARLRSGISIAEAQRRADVLAARFQEEMPRDSSWRVILQSQTDARVPPSARLAIWLLLGAVGLVVLIACANVATLFLGRTFGRLRELGVRAAMGASAARLMRHVLLEAAVVAFLGGALALLMSAWILDASRLILPSELGSPELNYRAVVFAAGLVLASAVLCAIGPAIRATRHDFSPILSSNSRTAGLRREHRRLYRGLVAGELGLTFVLLLGAGLLTNSFIRRLSVDVGFEPRNLALVTVRLPVDRYSTNELKDSFYDEVQRRVALLPDVSAVTAGRGVPPQDGLSFDVDIDEIRDREPTRALVTPVESNYFETLRIPLLAGRSFAQPDTAQAEPVIVINDEIARHYWPHENPVGRRLRLGPKNWTVVVGVVSDVKGSNFTTGTDRFKAYVPLSQQSDRGSRVLAARTRRDPNDVLPQIRQIINLLDPNVMIYNASTAEAAYGRLLLVPRLSAQFLGLFSAGALILALIGIYGLVSSSVAQRQQEIGIRIALGANASAVRKLVVREALRPAAIGLVIGLCSGLAGSILLGRFLYGVSPYDPLTTAAVSAVLITAVAVVAWIPVRRATRIDPIVALRTE